MLYEYIVSHFIVAEAVLETTEKNLKAYLSNIYLVFSS